MRHLAGFVQRWIVFVIAVVIWQLATAAAEHPFFPTPWQILVECKRLWFTTESGSFGLADTVFEDIVPSLSRLLTGWTIAIVLGVALGTALGRSRTGMQYVGPLLAFFRTLPSPALVPVFIILIGLNETMGTALIVFGCVWPILMNTVDGVRSVDSVKTETARSFRTPRVQWVTMVVLPAALPKIFAGLRLSLSIAVILMVVSEMVGVTNGIGYQLIFAQSQFDITTLWSWMVLLGILGYVTQPRAARGRAPGPALATDSREDGAGLNA